MEKLIDLIKTVHYNPSLFLFVNDGFATPRLVDGKFVIDCVVTGMTIHQDEISAISYVTDSVVVFDTNEGSVEMSIGELKRWMLCEVVKINQN